VVKRRGGGKEEWWWQREEVRKPTFAVVCAWKGCDCGVEALWYTGIRVSAAINEILSGWARGEARLFSPIQFSHSHSLI